MATTMGQRLAGKTILITGASSGIGRSTAKEFARTCSSNLKLILAARRFESLQALTDEIRSEVGDGVRILPIKLDVSKSEDVSSFIGKLPDEFKDIDILVNNAYVFLDPCPILALLMILVAQWSRQGHCPGPRHCLGRYPDHVYD
jgi:3-hydroxy acid dehydrogenase/malonic semialdehyde reductase